MTLALLAQAQTAPERLERLRRLRAPRLAPQRVIDLHSHLLPGRGRRLPLGRAVGQGAARMAEQGVTDVCLTPHLARASRAGPPPAHDAAFEASGAAPQLPGCTAAPK